VTHVGSLLQEDIESMCALFLSFKLLINGNIQKTNYCKDIHKVKMTLILNWLIFIALFIKCLSIQGEIFYVSNFGAYPNDNIDDSHGIQLAVNTAISSGLNSTVIFGSGTYNLSSTINVTNAINLTITGQGMDQTLLVGNNPLFIFFAEYCNGLTIRSFSIDFDPFPFTAGYITHVNDTYLDVQIQPPHRTDVNRQVHSIFRYDPIAMRAAFGSQAYQIFQSSPTNVSTSLVSPGVLRIPIRTRYQFIQGDPIVAIYDLPYNAISVKYTTDVTIQSITVYASWLMGLLTFRATRLNVIDYHAKPRDGHWLSTNSDCMHFTDAREYIYLSNSKCHLTGDDGLNVHRVYLLVAEVVNSSALILKAISWIEPVNIGEEIRLEFTSDKQPFTAHESGIVASSSILNSTDSRLFIFTTPVNVSVGDWAYVADRSILTVRNFTVLNNRGRGALLETRNVDIRNSVFNRTSAPAIFFQPSLFWREGPAAENVTLANNLYINCNEGISQEKGIITFLPDPIQMTPVVNDIRIESSTFYFGNYSQGIIQGNNANNVYLSGNYIATNSSAPLISICNSRNITASNNTFVDTQSKIDQYYTFDTTNPCQMNLSSLIDLPPSAFNSSFPPPV
jgi:hypothetical protein